ncbi:BgTH12-02301 [Blumeria graminis f. sp. triticale]|uniref:Phosphatidylinositol 3-kinase VPS34 n=3 Tax=Blumeria graminis TaxID=34373 RepID=A0A9X9MG46_BLUGR|nr:Phosphatidylinositol 3-kinase [Blumeria graminis f. sp. tritici 96224]CAD6502058.1 BgTH12-02301 [Blumeria graminis f. sp. triticale]VDB86026.1 Bgt-4907 [Blumeria graminis f. sp. tritici]
MDPFSFASSDAVEIPVNIKIVSLEGEKTQVPFSTLVQRSDLRHIGSNTSLFSDLYATVQLWADSKPLTVPIHTTYKPFKNERRWNEWLTLPINYSTLPLSAQLSITVWDLCPSGGKEANGHAIPFGGTTFPLFDKENQLHKGRQKCHLHRGKVADGLSSTTTPYYMPQTCHLENNENESLIDRHAEEMERLEKLFKKHEMGEIPRVEWLDQLVFRGTEKRSRENSSKPITKVQFRRDQKYTNIPDSDKDKQCESDRSNEAETNDFINEKFVLNIEFPRFDFPIVFSDYEYSPPSISPLQHLSSSQSNILSKTLQEAHFGPGIDGILDQNEGYGDNFRIYDPDVGARDNPVESKHRRLVRSHRTGLMDRDLKPNAKVRDELNSIIAYAPTHILSPEEKDLIWKFRHHLTSNKRALTKFVKSVNWQDQNECGQAVQILSSSKWTEVDVDDALELLGPTFDNQAVRAYAVDRLRKSNDNELLLYLLQLVQALKFEPISDSSDRDVTRNSSLAKFLIERATSSFMLGNHFHWYLMVECDDQSEGQGAGYRKLFAKVEYDFMTALVKRTGGVEIRELLLRQAELIAVISKISRDIKMSKESVARKTEKVKQYLTDPKNEIITINPPLPLPLDPSIMLTGIEPTETQVFKSSLFPIMLTFKTLSKQKYQIIFKSGDDLRQDQLVIQIITLMDQLLQKENLDLKLSPYKILATSSTAGAAQFVPSMSLQSIVNKFKGNSVLTYLASNNPDDRASLGVRKEALETFIKSCAGYCVITYLLGVGDRHLDNLLLAPDGHFFHADFGYILGRDPKPFAPAMKLCKEMVDGMGGSNSTQYAQFKQYCFTAYTTLRKCSNLILNLFSLMVDANIPDIRIEPDKVVLKVKERFHLELSEEEAIRHFDTLIEDSTSAIFPIVIDRLHGFVQHFRA